MTQPVSSVAPGLPVAPNPAIETGDNTKLSSKAFLQLLVAQLRYQDPSKPVDTASFMNETATLTQVQSSEQTAKVSLDMLSAQRAQTASSLVGHTVSYTGADGQLVTGYVSAATISTAKPTLKIGTVDVDLSQVQQVLATGTP
ncbi:MAG TPA: flagellar hook capping FlgD N-terminal domain-containing protein [Jatrophihabitans sp.]